MIPTATEVCVLHDVQEVTLVPHQAQEALSTEHTPTLSYSLPFYHSAIEKWQDLKHVHPLLAPYIEIGVQKVEEYINKSMLSHTYLFAVCQLSLPSKLPRCSHHCFQS